MNLTVGCKRGRSLSNVNIVSLHGHDPRCQVCKHIVTFCIYELNFTVTEIGRVYFRNQAQCQIKHVI